MWGRQISAVLSWHLLAVIMIAVFTSATATAKEKEPKPFIAKPVSPKQSIRFYKANKQLQADRVQLTGGDTDQAGCHNLLKKTRVFKAVQIGYGVCSLYQEKDCAVGSLVPAQSEKQKFSSYFLTEGKAWLPQGDDERGVKVASWNCAMAVEQGEMRAEKELSSSEVVRLRRAERESKRAMEEAQADYAKSKKAAADARRYAKRAKQEAIAIGAIEPDPEPEEEKQGDKKDGKQAKKPVDE